MKMICHDQHKPMRVIRREFENVIQGRTEHSFSMEWSNERAVVFWSGHAYSNLGTEHDINAIITAEHNLRDKRALIFDPFDEACPVIFDWIAWERAVSKFNRRNVPFVVKPFGTFVLRALLAERTLIECAKALDSWEKRAVSAEDNLAAIEGVVNETFTEDKRVT